MSKSRKLYETLGIAPGATLGEIRKAHRERVKARHPDVPGGSAEAFRETQHAWVVLRDPERRAKYDATGEDPGEAVDLRESMVLGVIQQHLGVLLQQPLETIVANPVISVMREAIAVEIKNLREQQAGAEKLIGKIERVKKRFRRKVEGRNMLVAMLDGNIAQQRQAIERIPEMISVREEARALLSDYEWEQEVVQWLGAGYGGTGQGQGFGLGSIFGSI